VATVCYALAVAQDHVVAIVFALNTAGCLAIVVLIAFKRMQPSAVPSGIAALRHSAGLVAQAAREPHPGATRELPSVRTRDEMIRQGLLG